MYHHGVEVHSTKGSKSHNRKVSGFEKHPDKRRTSKPIIRSDQRDSRSQPRHLSFLFVVNELEMAEVTPTVDQWGTEIPPDMPSHYLGEYPGAVFRYTDGRIDPAPEYVWERTGGYQNPHYGQKYPGRIVHISGIATRDYSTYTVFNCWRPLPCLYVETDPMSNLIGALGDGARWNLMGFHVPDGSGVTRIAPAGGGSEVVGGRHPTWMPSLVPAMFENTDGSLPRSVGLTGPLPVIIGRMALAYPRGRTNEPFATGMWHRRRWRGAIQPGAEVTRPRNIRGVLVHVALDDLMYPEFSTAELLRDLEINHVIIGDRE
ncbi:hypothetical protein GGS20DRAFT_462457 [Poronia punctata]|nr:hypothetical protein GGS20DRAFT_462457 [Poronia punctata]